MEPVLQIYPAHKLHAKEIDVSFLTIEIVAHSLSKQCRFNGNCTEFYSVAQHSIECSHRAHSKFALEALLHDAHEVITGDFPGPLKSVFPEFRGFERAVEAEVRTHFGLAPIMSSEVHDIDVRMLMTERRDFMVQSEWSWPIEKLGCKPYPSRLVSNRSMSTVEQHFIARYHELAEHEKTL